MNFNNTFNTLNMLNEEDIQKWELEDKGTPFEPGDVLHILPEWLDKDEDPNQDYIVFEDYGDGTVEVFCPDEKSSFGGYINVWANHMFKKVGHIELKK